MRKIEESISINRPAEDVFAYLENRSHDPDWMVSVLESHWLDADGAGSAGRNSVGRRGRMVMKMTGRRVEFIDEVSRYEPGRVIAHRTIDGPFSLNTACICEPTESGCVATVTGEAGRMFPGVLGRLFDPLVARGVRRSFQADLARLKQILER